MSGWGNAIGIGVGKGLLGGLEGYQWMKQLQDDEAEREQRKQAQAEAIKFRDQQASIEQQRDARNEEGARVDRMNTTLRDLPADTAIAPEDVTALSKRGWGPSYLSQTGDDPGGTTFDAMLPLAGSTEMGTVARQEPRGERRDGMGYRKLTSAELETARTKRLAELQRQQRQKFTAGLPEHLRPIAAGQEVGIDIPAGALESPEAKRAAEREDAIFVNDLGMKRDRAMQGMIAGREAGKDSRKPVNAGGRPMLAGDARSIADLDQSIALLDQLEAKTSEVGAASRVGAALPDAVTEYTGWGADSKRTEATIRTVRQIVGKAMEGGVLRKEDEAKYEAILPKIGDPPEIAKSKIDGLRTMLRDKRESLMSSLTDAGFNASGYQTPPVRSNTQGTPTPRAQPSLGGVVVETPSGPVRFKDQASADAFKRAAGIQ